MIRFPTTLSARFYSSATAVTQEQLKKRARRLIKPEGLVEKQQQLRSSVMAVCTAESYDLVAMAKRLQGTPSLIQNRDVLHFREESDSSPVDCFFFRHGSFVVWRNPNGTESALVNRFREFASPFEKTSLPVKKQETEEMPFKYKHLIDRVINVELIGRRRLE